MGTPGAPLWMALMTGATVTLGSEEREELVGIEASEADFGLGVLGSDDRVVTALA